MNDMRLLREEKLRKSSVLEIHSCQHKVLFKKSKNTKKENSNKK